MYPYPHPLGCIKDWQHEQMNTYVPSYLHPILKYLCIPAHIESNGNMTHKKGWTTCLGCPTQTLEWKKREERAWEAFPSVERLGCKREREKRGEEEEGDLWGLAAVAALLRASQGYEHLVMHKSIWSGTPLRRQTLRLRCKAIIYV